MSTENINRVFVSLKDLLQNVQTKLKQAFPTTYWVKAEVAGIRQSGQHIYFDLIELQNGIKTAQVKANAFAGEGTQAIISFERITGQRFVNGIRIGAQVKINFHPVFGMSLILCAIDAELTLGGIELQRKNTLLKLLEQNPLIINFTNGRYLTPNTLLKLKPVLQRIALVSSVGSDGYEDFMHCINTNIYHYRFIPDSYPTIVHGANAARSVINAINNILRSGIPYDAIVLIRGGGAPADFMPFDDPQLAMLIATCSIPVITGIGHHTNQGISDFFARVHTKTPTMAGQFLIDHNHSFETVLLRLSRQLTEKTGSIIMHQRSKQEILGSRIIEASRYFLVNNRQEINRMNLSLQPTVLNVVSDHHLALQGIKQKITSRSTELLKSEKYLLLQKKFVLNQEPIRLIKSERVKMTFLWEQLKVRLPQFLKSQQSDLFRLQQNFHNLSPENILKRGFAIIKKDESIIVDSSKIKEGDELQIVQASSVINTKVKNIKPRDGQTTDL